MSPDHFCRAEIRTAEGADHVGVDAFLRCPTCKRRTTHHYECWSVTDEVRKYLETEWSAGRITPQEPHHDR